MNDDEIEMRRGVEMCAREVGPKEEKAAAVCIGFGLDLVGVGVGLEFRIDWVWQLRKREGICG